MAKRKKKQSSVSNAQDVEAYINNMFGEGTMKFFSDQEDTSLSPDDFVSTGVLGIDKFLGMGFPRGKISELYGAQGGGKTTLALQVAADVTSKGERVMFIDVEQAFQKHYAKDLGVDLSKLGLASPSTGEEVFEIVGALCEKSIEQNIGLIIIDSVAAMCPTADHETDQMGSHARMMSKGLRKLISKMDSSKMKCAILFINQIRMKIGVMFGSPKTTTGGNALKFATSIRCEVTRIGKINDSTKDTIGQRCKLSTVKNKITSPYQSHEVDLMYGKGFCPVADAIELGVKEGIIVKTGAWYSIPGADKTIQGKTKLVEHYQTDEEEFKKLCALVKESWNA